MTHLFYIIDNNICYPRQVFHNIKYLFQTRYRLHKEVYTHKVVISYQFMINDIMKLLNEMLNISDSIYDVDDFCKLNDNFILASVDFLMRFINNKIIDKKNICYKLFYYLEKPEKDSLQMR